MSIFAKAKELKKNKKGFTLVELIVVLVILAILAAILVPALLGYIDKARDKQIVLNAKSVYTAAQAELSNLYASGKVATTDCTGNIDKTSDVPNDATYIIYVTKATTTDGINDKTAHTNYTIAGVTYTQDGKTTIFDGTSWDKDNTIGGDTGVLGAATAHKVSGN